MTFKPTDYAAVVVASVPIAERLLDAADLTRLRELFARLREARAGRLPCDAVLDRILELGDEARDAACKEHKG